MSDNPTTTGELHHTCPKCGSSALETWIIDKLRDTDSALAAEREAHEGASNPTTTSEWTVTSNGQVMLGDKRMVTAFNYDEGKALVDAINAALDAAYEKGKQDGFVQGRSKRKFNE